MTLTVIWALIGLYVGLIVAFFVWLHYTSEVWRLDNQFTAGLERTEWRVDGLEDEIRAVARRIDSVERRLSAHIDRLVG